MEHLNLIPTIVFQYFGIGLTFLGLLVFLIGIRGESWSKGNLWIILTWPVELVNLLGLGIGVIILKRDEKKAKESQANSKETK